MKSIVEFLVNKKLSKSGLDEFIDLGLPSGTLWCSHNIEADEPENIGNYYQWGDDITNKQFTKETYDIPLNLKKLTPEYDVASKAYKDNNVHIPSSKQFEELIKNTTTDYDSKGVTLKSKINNEKIYIPRSGYYANIGFGEHKIFDDENIYLWTNESDTTINTSAKVYIDKHNLGLYKKTSKKYLGVCVRPVKDK